MALKIFLFCLGGLFAGALGLWMLIKNFAVAFAAQGKKPLIYALVSGLIAGLILFGITYVTTTELFSTFWIFSGVFLVYGIIHMVLMHGKFYKTKETNFWKLFTGELIFAFCTMLVALLLFSVAEYFLRDRDYLFYPVLMSVLFFLVPLLFYHSYKAAMDIPATVFPTWLYPVGKSINPPDEEEGERLLVIGFEIAKKSTDGKKTYFRARAPEGIRLGELFYHFVNDYNELQSETPIYFIDPHNEAYEWWFRIKPKWYKGQRVLDPMETMKENAVRENSVIICERLIKPLNS